VQKVCSVSFHVGVTELWEKMVQNHGDCLRAFSPERAHSCGCGVRFPDHGDPAFDGLEIQMADFRYNTEAKDSELTGGIYRAIAPRKQVYKPTEWNKYQITLKGDRIKVILNDEVIQDPNLAEQNQEVKRHDGKSAPPVKDRPRK
jgi:hypothetical protein